MKSIRNYLRRSLTGYSVHQEYVCVPFEKVENRSRLFATCSEKKYVIEVTNDHLFLGYKPLLIGITLSTGSVAENVFNHQDVVCLSFHFGEFNVNGTWKNFEIDKNSHAGLIVRKLAVHQFGKSTMFLFQGEDSRQRMQHWVHQRVNQLHEFLKRRRPGNVKLDQALYNQVRIAYSIQRIISVITVAQGERMNMFPTDLHGRIDDEFYVSSLREGGRATEQVESNRFITISDISADQYREVYALGRNHMQDMKPLSEFPIHRSRSPVLKLPFHAEAVSFRELELVKTVTGGIHKIHFYRILDEGVISDQPRLSHIHKLYAQWRLDNKMKTTLLYR